MPSAKKERLTETELAGEDDAKSYLRAKKGSTKKKPHRANPRLTGLAPMRLAQVGLGSGGAAAWAENSLCRSWLRSASNFPSQKRQTASLPCDPGETVKAGREKTPLQQPPSEE